MSAFETHPAKPHDPAIDAAMELMHELDAEKTDGPVRAHWVGRMLARLIDVAILFVAAVMIIASIETAAVGFGADLRDEDFEPTGLGTAVAWATLVALLAFGAAYEVVPTWLWGQTPGKRRMQLRVVNLEGSRLTLRQAAARFAAWGVPFLGCFFGWLATFPRYPAASLAFFLGVFASLGLVAWAGRDADGRGVHDRFASTKVIWEK